MSMSGRLYEINQLENRLKTIGKKFRSYEKKGLKPDKLQEYLHLVSEYNSILLDLSIKEFPRMVEFEKERKIMISNALKFLAELPLLCSPSVGYTKTFLNLSWKTETQF